MLSRLFVVKQLYEGQNPVFTQNTWNVKILLCVLFCCRCITFHPEGHCLFSGAQDSMRVYGWEPVRCYDSFSLAWGKVADIAVSSSQLVSYRYMYCTFNTLVLYVHVLYLFVIEGFKTPTKQISPIVFIC